MPKKNNGNCCRDCMNYKELPLGRIKAGEESGSTVCLVGISTQPDQNNLDCFQGAK